MKVFSTSMHAKIDYIAGIFFLASPWIFDFTESVPAVWTVIAVAATALTMSIFTDYEGGMIRSIPMRIHLIVDILTGALLAASPWLFGFADQVYLPHLIMGLFEISAGLLTTKYSPDHNAHAVVDPNADGVNGSTF
ncbi:SPW repeat protein [Dyadobacter sp. CY261]|uniref:SPW repeat domain-containing protein n=1 Tax=Dyadobacter sp. CY261 TaxID=2907203 RepID=UPI001F1F70F3|nr:SPW repeat protein [Dyadobacter sp. CY261]MCF0072798.1 SPW repeat protein [Dyadobacter sp. CY261]